MEGGEEGRTRGWSREALLDGNDVLRDAIRGGAHLQPSTDEHAKLTASSHNNLNTLNGCYIPCLLNILGAVLFLRVGFAVGMMGWPGALAIFCFSELIAYLTITSFSALATNGRMRGGGAYYMISRSLGPAFGGSSGLLFWLTYCLNVTFNTVAFTETFVHTFLPQWDSPAHRILVSTGTLFSLFLVAFKGAGAFARVNLFIFIGLVISLVSGIGTLYFHQDAASLQPHLVTLDCPAGASAACEANAARVMRHELFPRGEAPPLLNVSGAFFPWAWSAACPQRLAADGQTHLACAASGRYGLKETMRALPVASETNCNGGVCDVAQVFGIVFPAVVGMMEGANLSGDLKDPAKSIPAGTIGAVTTAFVCYLLLIFGQAGSVDRYSLQFDMNVMQHACVNQYLIVLGVATACLSTALGSMFGSARILQEAIARDNIFPFLRIFRHGSVVGDEPRVAVVFCYAIAQMGIFIGDLNDVAPILTNFFLVTYALTNLAAALLEASGVPNWRPHFRYSHRYVSLLGSVLTLAAMVYLNPTFAAITLAVVVVLFAYVSLCFKGGADWVDISHALWYASALRTLQRLRRGPVTSKYWRPSLLLVLADESTPTPLAALVGHVARGAPLVVGRLLCCPAAAEDVAARAAAAQAELTSQLDRWKKLLPAFSPFEQLAVCSAYRHGVLSLALGAGMGALRPETVVLPLLGAPDAALPLAIAELLQLRRNVLLAANFERAAAAAPRRRRVDVWLFGAMPSAHDGSFAPAHAALGLAAQFGALAAAAPAGGARGVAKAAAEAGGGAAAARRRPIAAPPPRRRASARALRLLELVGAAAEGAAAASPPAALVRWAHEARLRAECVGVGARGAPSRALEWAWADGAAGVAAVNAAVRAHSADAALVMLLLPPPRAEGGGALGYMELLRGLCAGLPPTILCGAGATLPVIATDI
ncbi:hypothetical protein AB1Y20_002358 [Prymnesium parvum]|uniref:Amino acid permease/ SLC12A domain-containing protein n=1 Tax=Prymnesium parvum TaxID=97485 RepID=A0AB34J8V2_PRYPA